MKTKTLTFFLFLISTTMSLAQINWYNQDSGTNSDLLGVSFVDGNNGWIGGGYGTMLRTTNGGEDWLTLTPPVNAYLSIYFTDLQNGWAGGYSGFLIHTTDGGQTWINQFYQISSHIYSLYFINADTGWAAGGDIASFPNNYPETIIYKTTDGGYTWDLQYYEQYSPILHDIYFFNSNNGYALGGAYLFHTTDGGAVWTQQTVSVGNVFNGMYFADQNTGWVSGESTTISNYHGVIYKTTDGGNTWNGTTLGADEKLSDINFSDDLHGWVVGFSENDSSGVIYYTSDGGSNWSLQNTPAFSALYKLAIINSNAYAVGHLGTIGTTENSVPVELTSFTASTNENDVTLNWQTATEINNCSFEVFCSTSFDNWVQIGIVAGHGTTTLENNYSFIDKDLDPGNYSYKIIQVDFDGSQSESDIVHVEVTNEVTDYILNQNYPNPFNPTTTIKYSIPESGNVKLSVYNTIGKEVSKLVNGYKEAGTYKVNFDASVLGSGIYYYKIIAGNFSSIKKMILLK